MPCSWEPNNSTGENNQADVNVSGTRIIGQGNFLPKIIKKG